MITVTNGNSTGVWIGNDVFYIGRGDYSAGLRQSPLCNPYTFNDYPSRKDLVSHYHVYLAEHIQAWLKVRDDAIKRHTLELPHKTITIMSQLHLIADTHKKGKCVNLVCYCKPLICHGDVIKEQVEKLVNKGLL